MKVLLINGFSNSSAGRRSFQRFEATIKNVSLTQAFKLQKCFSKEEIEFEVVDKDSIDIYLFEMNSGFLSKDSEKVTFPQLFDHLDMVFVDGDSTILPWFPKARKVSVTQFLIMIRMCKRTGKVLFATSFAMQMFTYLCATNIFVNRVVNGNGKGTPLRLFGSMPKSTLAHLEYGDLFLDSATGDIYAYDQAKEEYYPIANSSVHNHKAAQEDSKCHIVKARSSMLKSYRYIPQNFEESDRVYISQLNESRCRILKQYIQHWLSDRLMYREFLVPCPNTWDVHPVNSSEAENIYHVFAESPRAPLIITQKNAVCTQFHIDPRYPETVIVLENFIRKMSEKIYTEKVRMDLPLANVVMIGYSKPAMSTAQPNQKAQSGHHSIPFNTAKHSGYAFSKRDGPVLVKNNATTSNTIKATGHDESDESNASSGESSYSFDMHRKKRGTARQSLLERRGSRSPKRQVTNKSEKQLSLPVNAGVPISKTDWTTVTWSRQEIREFLHPGYPVEIMRNRPYTGSLTATAASTSSKLNVVKYKTTPFRYCRYKEFPQPTSPRVPSITLRSQDGTPFIESERAHLHEEKQNKERWVARKDFQRVFRPVSRADVKAVVDIEPATTVTSHKFRDVFKEKWVAGGFKN